MIRVDGNSLMIQYELGFKGTFPDFELAAKAAYRPFFSFAFHFMPHLNRSHCPKKPRDFGRKDFLGLVNWARARRKFSKRNWN